MHDTSGSGFKDRCCAAQMHAELTAACKRNMHGVLEWLEQLTDNAPLKTLALHNLYMPPQHTMLLHNAFRNVSDSLVELVLDLCMATGAPAWSTCMGSMRSVAEVWSYSYVKKQRVFETIACLVRLKRLTIPKWVEFLGKDLDSPEPLTKLESLESVHVSKLPEESASGWSWNFILV